MVTVNQKEFQRVKVIENAVAGRLRVSEAARLLQLSERQVQRLKRRFCPDSVAWVHHGNRGRPMPRALAGALRPCAFRPARWGWGRRRGGGAPPPWGSAPPPPPPPPGGGAGEKRRSKK